MKKLFNCYLVLFTFAFGMMSCSDTMGLYSDEGIDTKVLPRRFPIDYGRLANDLDSLGLLYGRDILVYGVPDIEYQSVLKLTANAMRSISEREVGNCFVLITDDEIVKDSLSGHRSVNPDSNEYVTTGSYTFEKIIYPFLLEDVTIGWSNHGPSVSMIGYTINARNIRMEVSPDFVTLSGHFSVIVDSIISHPSNNMTSWPAYGFYGVSGEEDTWEIHPFAEPYPTPGDRVGSL